MIRRVSGFTLIELVVSLAIFAVIFVVSYETLGSILDGKSTLDSQRQQWQQLDMAFTQMQDDFRFATPRPTRDLDGTTLPPLVGMTTDARALARPTLELTRGGIYTLVSKSETGFRRIAYRLQDNTLYREIWPTLDRKFDAQPTSVLMATGISAIDIRYLDRHEQWNGHWPTTPETRTELPLAVDVSLTLADNSRLNRLFLINE